MCNLSIMRFSSAAAIAGASVASVNAAALQGFNYGATLTTGAAKVEADFTVSVDNLVQ